MKKTAFAVAALALSSFSALAITPDEIIGQYLQNTGGADNWKKLSGLKLSAEMQQGAMKFPIESVQLKDGRTYTRFEVQGKQLNENVFDGNVLWGTNFMTMKAEPSTAEETANFKLDINDFPSEFVDYQAKGYKAELVGEESIDGTPTYKVKLTKEPMTIDGRQVDDVTFNYFDKETMVLLVQEGEITSGPAKGKIGQTKFSDYQEVNGLYFPFSIAQGLKDGPSAPMSIKKIELNPSVDNAAFAMPAAQ